MDWALRTPELPFGDHQVWPCRLRLPRLLSPYPGLTSVFQSGSSFCSLNNPSEDDLPDARVNLMALFATRRAETQVLRYFRPAAERPTSCSDVQVAKGEASKQPRERPHFFRSEHGPQCKKVAARAFKFNPILLFRRSSEDRLASRPPLDRVTKSTSGLPFLRLPRRRSCDCR